jgi:SAM-dependent methyltransferase
MSDTRRDDRLAELAAMGETWRATAAEFVARNEACVDSYRREISNGMDEALRRLREDVDRISGGNDVARRLSEQTSEYAGWMQWSLWDLPAFAVAIRPKPDAFRAAVIACGLVYTAIRIFDDLVDQHYSYKGRHDTLLAAISDDHARPHEATALSSLAGLLLCFEGLQRLSDPGQPIPATTLPVLVSSIRRAVVGAIMEFTDLHAWSLDSYSRLVRLKNVDYWRALYAAVDPQLESPLYPFLERYYELAQYLNDVGDYESDLASGQPNLMVLHHLHNGHREPGHGPPSGRVRREVEGFLADQYLALGCTAAELPDIERSVAQFKLHESLTAARRLGLFDRTEITGTVEPAGAPPRLFWYSEARDVIDHAGPDALVYTDCDVCGTRERRLIFHHQGFAYHRCPECSHVYVSPRVSAEVQTRMLADLDDPACEDRYLDVQRIYAEPICALLHDRAPGHRLLDIGFGRGYLMQMAQAYGFEVHGVEGSRAQVAKLRPQFGDRVVHCVLGRDGIPWDGLDAVVMSHVLEHLHDPRQALTHIRERMSPGGWLYLAVPDLGSTHFKILGKRWDAINPLAHLQYFTEASLNRLLTACSFEDVERTEHPRIPDEVAPRWMRLIRQLGGSESSELVLLARAPGGA